MADDNLSLVIHKANDLRLENTEVPEPGKGEVQVRMSHVGICGSDVHLWRYGSLSPHYPVNEPFILGHETSGVISKLGEGVTNVCVGDRVTMEPIYSCKTCTQCKTGRYNICPQRGIIGLTAINGGLRRYHVHQADLSFKLPDSMSMAEGALIEPMCVAIHAAKRAGVTFGSRVLICGAGTIGLLTLVVSKLYGAAQVCITDLKQNRLQIAKELGADVTIEVKTDDPRELASIIEQAMGGKPNISLECSAAPSCVQSAIYVTEAGGCLLVVGLGSDLTSIPLIDATLREVDIRGILGFAHHFPVALAMMQTGKMNVQPIITHIYKLEESFEALKMFEKGEGVKIMINCSNTD